MSDIKRALLILNRVSGLGHNPELERLLSMRLAAALGHGVSCDVSGVTDHASARRAASACLRDCNEPVLIVAGGGGGTLRAVIEGVCEHASDVLPGVERVRIGALRMGSGNVLAKQFGVPRDPLAGLDGLLRSLSENRTAPCCVMRCDVLRPNGDMSALHAGTLGGFGQFGRVPGDLARWHERLPETHQFVGKLLGVERLTTVEYALSLLLRSFGAALCPELCERVEVQVNSCAPTTLTLLAGALLNFKLPGLPFEPGVRVEDAALSLQLIPLKRRLDAMVLVLNRSQLQGKATVIRIGPSDVVQLKLIDRVSAEFFLDEDPELFRELSIRVAGTLAFVPGPEYSA